MTGKHEPVVLRGTAACALEGDPELMGVGDSSGNGCEVESPGEVGGDLNTTLSCIPGLTVVLIVDREGYSDEYAVWGMEGDVGRLTPLLSSTSCGSSMRGRGREEWSGKVLVEAREAGVPSSDPSVLVPGDLCAQAEVLLDPRGLQFSEQGGGDSGRGGSWLSVLSSRGGCVAFGE